MSRFAQGIYEVKNPAKYVGLGKPRYRSSWEMAFMAFCDSNENIIQWASESVRIPYRNPLTGKQTVYVPDFLVVYRDKNNRTNAELIEIKPSAQASLTEARGRRDQAAVIVNQAKWAAASQWCQRAGVQFRVITERDMFHNGRR